MALAGGGGIGGGSGSGLRTPVVTERRLVVDVTDRMLPARSGETFTKVRGRSSLYVEETFRVAAVCTLEGKLEDSGEGCAG